MTKEYKTIKIRKSTWVKLQRMKHSYISKYKETISLDELIRMMIGAGKPKWKGSK